MNYTELGTQALINLCERCDAGNSLGYYGICLVIVNFLPAVVLLGVANDLQKFNARGYFFFCLILFLNAIVWHGSWVLILGSCLHEVLC